MYPFRFLPEVIVGKRKDFETKCMRIASTFIRRHINKKYNWRLLNPYWVPISPFHFRPALANVFSFSMMFRRMSFFRWACSCCVSESSTQGILISTFRLVRSDSAAWECLVSPTSLLSRRLWAGSEHAQWIRHVTRTMRAAIFVAAVFAMAYDGIDLGIG